jgi:hypothetical protein
MAGQSLERHPVNVIAACQRLHNRFAPRLLQIVEPEYALLQQAGFEGCNLPLAARHADRLALPCAAPSQELLRNKKCP